MSSELSLGVRRRGQRRFLLFTYFNVISFNFLSGTIITLYALRLGADSLVIGLLAAFVHVAELMPPFGKSVVRSFGAVRVMAVSWIVRYLAMAPLLFAPLLLDTPGGVSAMLALCALCTLGFNVARGIGITSHNPIIGAITSTRDRGSFLSRNQLVIQTMSILTGVVIAVMLGGGTGTEGLSRYSLIIGVGIIAGLIAALLIFGLPEPLEARRAARTPILSSLRKGLERTGFRRFLVVHFLTFLLLNMAGPFLVVFLKRTYLQPDATVIFVTVIGSAGAIATALLAGMLLDRFGAKPFYFIFAVLVVLSLLLPVVAPQTQGVLAFWLYAGALFFLYNMGAVGVSTSVNTYFFALIAPEERLNLGIVYFLLTGLAGSAGSLLGGWILKLLIASPGLGEVAKSLPAFRLYFGSLAAAVVALMPLILGLEKLGSRDVRDVLSTILSLRDLRAIVLLGKLGRSSELSQELRVIQALGESSSGVPREELVRRLESPQFGVRMEALTALTGIPLDAEIEAALIAEVRSHPFTTAHVAAEIIGVRRVTRAARELREALRSPDYMLQAESMVALARLGDLRSAHTIGDLVCGSPNPRIQIYGAQALEIMGGSEAVPRLLAALSRPCEQFVRDEIVLSLSGTLGMKRDFYPWYAQFLSRALVGHNAVRDFMQERILARASSKAPAEVLSLLLEESASGGAGFDQAVRESLRGVALEAGGVDVTATFRETLENEALAGDERYRFLLASAVVWFSFRPDLP